MAFVNIGKRNLTYVNNYLKTAFLCAPSRQTHAWLYAEFHRGRSAYTVRKWMDASGGTRGWVGLWGFLWWAPSAKRKDHHGVSSGWSSVWHRSNTGLSSTQCEQIPIKLGVWPFWLTLFFFSINNISAGLWLNCISSVEITLFLLADILLQHRALFQC